MDDQHDDKFKIGEVVLAEWTDKLFYAKILQSNASQGSCTLLFDDDSIEECPVDKIHSVTETTADIVCIICKDGASLKPNEIVLCDKCGIGYHQKCHEPNITDKALEPEEPWMCIYCTHAVQSPYLLNPFETKLKNLTRNSAKNIAKTKDPYTGEATTAAAAAASAAAAAATTAVVYYNQNKEILNSSMGEYHHDPYSRLRNEASRSRARHVLSGHRLLDSHHAMERRWNGKGYYTHPERYRHHQPSRGERSYQYNPIESSRKKRKGPEQEMAAHQKQKPTQDVWDNGYPPSRDTMMQPGAVDRLDANLRAKNSGKDGPREKQRLTQDLEKQRKKLQEDMERGQVLRREHTQLLTRDPCQSKDDDDGMDDEGDAADPEERTYPRNGGNWSDYSSRSTPSRDRVEVIGNGGGREGLESCACKDDDDDDDDDDDGHSTKVEGCGDIQDDLDNMQCEHSTSSESNTTDDIYHLKKQERKNHSHKISKHKEVSEQEQHHQHQQQQRVFTSETLEVLGQSNDIDNNPLPEQTPSKQRLNNNKSSKKKTVAAAVAVKKKRSEKSDSDAEENGKNRSRSLEENEYLRPGETQLEVSSASDMEDSAQNKGEKEVVDNIVTQNRVRSDLPRHNWLIERLKHEKKLPVTNNNDRKLEEERVFDTKEEVTSSNVDQNSELVKAPAQSTTSPILDDKDIEDSLQQHQHRSNFHEQSTLSNESSPHLKVVSPSQSEENCGASISPELGKYSSTSKEDDFSNKQLLEIRDSPAVSQRNTNEDSSEETVEIMDKDHDKKTRQNNENERTKEKIIEIKSDGEGSDDVKQQNTRITTGKSVNPVSPFLRSERQSCEKTSKELRHGPPEMISRDRRLPPPNDLGGMPLVPPGYFHSYSPKTFTPHLITHNTPPMLASPVPPRHLPLPNYHHMTSGGGRLELGSGQTKPDHNCPYHGKKATAEKMIHHAPGYPMMHGDLVGRVPFHDELTTAMKMRGKYREQLELVPDVLGIPRRLPTIYDHPLMMPHGLHGAAIHHPGYLPPGIIDEHSYMEREFLKRRAETAAAYAGHHDPAKYARAHNTAMEEPRNVAKMTSSPEKSPKDTRSSSVEHRLKRPSSIEKVEKLTSNDHEQKLQSNISSSQSLSPKQDKYNKHFELKKHVVNHSPTVASPHGSLATSKDPRGSGESDVYYQPTRTLNQESVRYFNERFNMLNRTFKEKLDGAEFTENKDKAVFLENNHRRITSIENRHNMPIASSKPRSPDIKYKPENPPDNRVSPHNRTRFTSEEMEQQRRLMNRKPVMAGYRPEHGSISRDHEVQTRDSMSKVAYMRGLPSAHEYPPYDVTPWGVSTGRLSGYLPGRTPVEHMKPVPFKNEREKMEYSSSHREQEKDIDVAREKHRINLVHFEQERAKAMIHHERSRVLPRNDDGRPRIADSLDQRSVAKIREVEELESRKRKMEEATQEKNLEAKRTKLITKSDLPPMEIPGDLDRRKEHYLSMYNKSHINPAYRHHVNTIPYSGVNNTPSNAPYYVGRFDLQRAKHERTTNEVVKKHEIVEKNVQKIGNYDKELESSDKKRTKLPRMCDVCGKEASFLCSVCQKAWYCSSECQLEAWSEHSKHCGEAKRR